MFPKYSTQWQLSIIFIERKFCTYCHLFIPLHLFCYYWYLDEIYCIG